MSKKSKVTRPQLTPEQIAFNKEREEQIVLFLKKIKGFKIYKESE